MAKKSKALAELDEAVDEAIRKIRAIRDAAQADIGDGSEAMQAAIERNGLDESRRGPKRGTGGRPRKGEGRREQKGVSLDPAVIAWVESQRAAAESFSETLERILRGNMHKN